MRDFITSLEQNTFQGAFGVLCVVLIVLAAFVGWRMLTNARADAEQVSDGFASPGTTSGDGTLGAEAEVAPDDSSAGEDDEADDQQGEEEEEDNVFDILASNDEELEFLDTEVGMLMFFYTNGHDVCDEQWDAVYKLSLAREEIRFLSVDATCPDTAPIAALHGVHHVPSFVFRRKGDITYRTLIGLLDEQQLTEFIDFAMQNPTVVQNAS